MRLKQLVFCILPLLVGCSSFQGVDTDSLSDESIASVSLKAESNNRKISVENFDKTSKSTSYKLVKAYDDGGPFTTNEYGDVFDRWGNLIWEAPRYDGSSTTDQNWSESSWSEDTSSDWASIDHAWQWDQGTLSIPDLGIEVHVYRDDSQGTTDSFNANMLTSFGTYGGLGQGAVIAAHNGSGPFGGLGGVWQGMPIYVTTDYGTFEYAVSWTETASYIGDASGWGNIYGDTSGLDISGMSWSTNGLVLYTCYPFNSSSTSQRFIVYCDYIDGTTLS